MSTIHGVVTAKVKDVKDPAAQGRVLVSFPWLPENNDSYWAPVATLMSGGKRGSWFMPEKDDEVLVAFEHGNVDQPFVIGYLWNGVQKPPDDGGNDVRRVKTVAGHVLEFHDEDGGHQILLKTAGGQKLVLDDSSSTITITTSDGQKAELSPGKISLSTAGEQSFVLTDSPPSATLQVPPATVSVDTTGASVVHPEEVSVTAGTTTSVTSGVEVSITGGTGITLSAPVVKIAAPITTVTGVLMAQTLIATTAVVSPSYTPGAGNVW